MSKQRFELLEKWSDGVLEGGDSNIADSSWERAPRVQRGKRSALCLFERGVEAFEAGLRPKLSGFVVIPERRRSLRQLEPLRFPSGVDVYVRLKSGGLIERSDSHEPEIGPAPVVAPYRGLTFRAAVDVVRTVLARDRHSHRLTA